MRKESVIGIIGVITFIAFLGFVLLNRENTDMVYVNCDSFKTQPEAQEYFTENNATHLDGDKDGIACEELDPEPTFFQRVIPTFRQTPQPTQSPEPAVIKIEGSPTLKVIQVTPTPTSEPTEQPTSEPTATPTVTPTVTPQPTATPLVCVLGICL